MSSVAYSLAVARVLAPLESAMNDVATEQNLDVVNIEVFFAPQNRRKRSSGDALALIAAKFSKILTKSESQDLLGSKTFIKNQLRNCSKSKFT